MASAFKFLSGFQGATARGQRRSLSRKGHGESSVLSVTSSDREPRRPPHRVGLPLLEWVFYTVPTLGNPPHLCLCLYLVTAGHVAQLMEYLPNMHKALDSTPKIQ